MSKGVHKNDQQSVVSESKEKLEGEKQVDEYTKIRQTELEDSILIDFFLTVGIPESLAITMVKEVEEKHKGNYSTREAFDDVCEIMRKEDPINTRAKDCILNLYPDCQSEKMNRNDPRLNQLDQHTISQMPAYAFPLGLNLKRQADRPLHEVLPMIFTAGINQTYLQYLIFYENLEIQYKPAMKLFEKVQDEIDE